MNRTLTQQQQQYRNPYDSPFRWQLKDLVLVVVLGVVFGFVYWALVQAWNGLSIVMGPAGDLAQHFLQGGWLLVAPLAVAIKIGRAEWRGSGEEAVLAV